MNSHEGIENYLKTIIKVGTVKKFLPAEGRAIVEFPEEKLESWPMLILHPNAAATRDYNVLKEGENVLCLFLPTGRESGFILGSLYRDTFKPAENDAHTRSVVFPDGTRVAYDWEGHELTADVKGTAEVTATGDITLASGGSITIAASGSLNLQSGAGGSWTGGGGINIGGD